MHAYYYSATKEECEQMIVFAKEVFKRVNIYSINVGTARGKLSMMVLVNKTVDCFNMQSPVQNRIEEVIYGE
jgi:hypothetical protein